ncbi:hypothetical protein [Alteromonas mediterranea]|uniref:hypothetical protein n=1 Tax=Alteromonas mediterranea TaxID=314275 RepID=UPI000AF7A0BE|nr:hypothetical protein [Alteromonas mediterranea]
MDVLLTVEAANKSEDLEVAKAEFAKGNYGRIRYSDDDSAATDFAPFSAYLSDDIY